MELLHRIDFSNTAIAFAGKSNRELSKSYWMFRLMNAKWLVDTLSLLAPLAIKLRLPIDWAVKATIYQQFCGGETIEGCENAIAELNEYHIGTILDYAVEGKKSEAEFDACEAEIIRTIEKARGDHRIPFSVFKVTAVARFELLEKINRHETLTPRELEEWGRIWKRVYNIAKTALNADKPLLIDAEESWIQETIDQLVTRLMEEFNGEKPIVYNTIQLYRHDRLAFLKRSYEIARRGNYKYAVKLVRGAYMEKERERAQELEYPSPIHPNQAACDRDFNEALKFCVERIEHMALCSGSHNEKSNLYLTQLMAQHRLPPSHKHIWFAQLKGMSDHISYNLAFAGYNVCKYLPYAPVRAMLPYLIRRAQENTSISGQMSRELSLILRERERRQQQPA